MSKGRRFVTILTAILIIQGALVLMLVPDIAVELIAMGVGIMLTYYGVRFLLYYLTHARHMVGGKWFLLIGMLLFDAGVFATAIYVEGEDNLPTISTIYDEAAGIALLYIIGAHVVMTGLRFVRAAGNKKDSNPGWKIDFAQGIGHALQVILCLVFINYVEVPVFIYCIGSIYSAILMIISAFRKTAIVYVQ